MRLSPFLHTVRACGMAGVMFCCLAAGMWLCVVRPVAAASSPIPSNAVPGLERMAGAMIMMGFHGTELASGDPFLEAVREGLVGHVVLLDRKSGDGGERNIKSADQVRRLIRTLRDAAPGTMLMAVEQEGGKVTLRRQLGLVPMPSAKVIGRGTPGNTQVLASRLGLELAGLGVNVNLAPDADVDTNPANPTIGAQERSFGPDPALVSKHVQAFSQGMIKAGIAPTLKYFPGLGSAHGDANLGTADVTAGWNSQTDLKPYVDAFLGGWPGMVMTGHMYHRRLDPQYPATLSSHMVNGLLRTTLGWNGVVISDDMQAKAITDHFPLDQAIMLAVNAGVDILLFENNLQRDPEFPRTVHTTLVNLVRAGTIPNSRIRQAWQRIAKLCAPYAPEDAVVTSRPSLVRIH